MRQFRVEPVDRFPAACLRMRHHLAEIERDPRDLSTREDIGGKTSASLSYGPDFWRELSVRYRPAAAIRGNHPTQTAG